MGTAGVGVVVDGDEALGALFGFGGVPPAFRFCTGVRGGMDFWAAGTLVMGTSWFVPNPAGMLTPPKSSGS